MIREEDLREQILFILCYLATSARGVLFEPRLYAPYRLLEGLNRIIGHMKEIGLSDPEWIAINEEIDQNIIKILSDEEACKLTIDNIICRLTRQLIDS